MGAPLHVSFPLAVVPTLLGPLQTLLLVLPLIAMGFMLVARSLASPMAWRQGIARLLREMGNRPLKAGIYLLFAALLPALLWWSLLPVESPPAEPDTAVAQGNWPTFHGDTARTGRGDIGAVSPEAAVVWKFRDALILERRPFASSPAVAGGRVLAGSDNFKLYCVKLDDGAPLWTFEAQHPIFSSPVVWQERVYVGEGLHYTTDAKFYCLDLASGRVVWDFQTSSHTESTATVRNGKVYFGAGNDGLYCLDAVSGRVEWRFAGAHVDGGSLVRDDRVYFGSGYGTKAILCVDAADGRQVWRKDLPVPAWGAPASWGGRLYVGIGNGNFNESDENPLGEILCLDPESGREIWQFSSVDDGVLTSVAVSESRAVFGSRDGGCYALNARNGELVWRVDVEIPILSSPAIAGGHVFFGADDGLFYCLDLKDGRENWSFDTGDDLMLFANEDGRIQSSPAVIRGKVIFGASNGYIYCLGGDTTPAGDAAAGSVAQTEHRSRLMRSADSVIVGLIEGLARATGSFGLAVILAALVLKLALLPLEWKQSRQLTRLQDIEPEVRRLQREYVDYRIHRFKLRRLYAQGGVRPLGILCLALVQVPLLIVVFLVIQSTPVLAKEGFLWISDLSVADRIARLPAIPGLGSELNVLPAVLAGSVWLYAVSLRGPGGGPSLAAKLAWFLLAVCLATLTYRWPAALHLFFVSLLWIGLAQLRILSVRARKRQRLAMQP